jgi:hypothetical protein
MLNPWPVHHLLFIYNAFLSVVFISENFFSYHHCERQDSVYQNEIVIAAICFFIFGAFLTGIGITLIVMAKNKTHATQPLMKLNKQTKSRDRRR